MKARTAASKGTDRPTVSVFLTPKQVAQLDPIFELQADHPGPFIVLAQVRLGGYVGDLRVLDRSATVEAKFCDAKQFAALKNALRRCGLAK